MGFEGRSHSLTRINRKIEISGKGSIEKVGGGGKWREKY